LVQLGKFGAFPASQLLGLHYDITYEIQTPKPSSPGPGPGPVGLTVSEAGNEEAEEGAGAGAKRTFGQPMGKKAKKQKGKGKDAGGGEWRGQRTNPAWNNVLRPLKRKPIVEAVIGKLQLRGSGFDHEELRSVQRIFKRPTSS
jgi:tRNA (adenine-N(1)-)-methyltransferase non-catalytic subunit